jgi:hypothetical protein
MDKEEYDDGNNNKSDEGANNNNNESADTIGKDIKKGMDRYEAKIKSGEEPTASDSTRSEE